MPSYRRSNSLSEIRIADNRASYGGYYSLLSFGFFRSLCLIHSFSPPLCLFLFPIFRHFYVLFRVGGYAFSNKMFKLRRCMNSYFLFTFSKLHRRFYVRERSRSRAPLPQAEVPRTPARFRAMAITGKIPVIRRETIEITTWKLG